MKRRRVVTFVGLAGLTMLVGGCADEGSGVAGPVPKEKSPARSGEDHPRAGGEGQAALGTAGTGMK
jgi:hypothetical protein